MATPRAGLRSMRSERSSMGHRTCSIWSTRALRPARCPMSQTSMRSPPRTRHPPVTQPVPSPSSRISRTAGMTSHTGGSGHTRIFAAADRQTQVDSGGIEGVDGGIELDTKGVLRVQWPGQPNEVPGKVGVDLPRSRGVGIRQRVSRHRPTANAHVVQPAGLRPQVDVDVAQGLPSGQLHERHYKEPIQTREVLDLVLAPMGGETCLVADAP